jgi:site-specific DNA-methyltransferase (adenine-specific)
MRIERIGECTLYNADCREVLPLLPKVDAVVTDPPYGLGELWHGGTKKWPLAAGGAETKKWDMEPSAALLPALALAEHAIVWGGNYYDLPQKRGWLVWDKVVRNFTSGHVELAWTTIDQPTRAFNYAHGELASEGKFHPTQKPLPLMRWCIHHLPEPNRTILDPFLGSGTTGVACVKLGRSFIGIEVEPKYFEIAVRRIEEAHNQPDMFVEQPKGSSEQLQFEDAFEKERS